MKPLRAAATTSQPVLSLQQIETIFFKVPELHQIHKDFYDRLLPRVQAWSQQQSVGDLFQKLVGHMTRFDSSDGEGFVLQHCLSVCLSFFLSFSIYLSLPPSISLSSPPSLSLTFLTSSPLSSSPPSPTPPISLLQASQLGVYRAFVDNYKTAVATADRCCQANVQFAEISEVGV